MALSRYKQELLKLAPHCKVREADVLNAYREIKRAISNDTLEELDKPDVQQGTRN
jgi:hypothetical protein